MMGLGRTIIKDGSNDVIERLTKGTEMELWRTGQIRVVSFHQNYYIN